MDAKIKVTAEIPTKYGKPVITEFYLPITMAESSEIKIEYKSQADGGPVLRPSKPPK